MAEQPTPPPTETAPERLDRLLEKRPPLPPMPVDARWSWTRQKLKAVYLEAFTTLKKAEIAAAIGIGTKAFWQWRRAPDYRRYLATLIAADGLADRAERVKARKRLADKLGEAIATKLDQPSALAGEKLSSLLKAQREMLDSLEKDATSLQELGAEQDAAARAGQARPGLDLVERLALIEDQGERDIVKKHLLRLMGEYLDAPRIIDAAPITESAERVKLVKVAEASAPDAQASADQSSPLDLESFAEAEAPNTAGAPPSAAIDAESFTES